MRRVTKHRGAAGFFFFFKQKTAYEMAIEERATVVGVLGQAGMEMDVEFQNMFEKMLPAKREARRLSVADARKVLFAQEAEKLLDRDKIYRTAIERVEQTGIVFLDELDK